MSFCEDSTMDDEERLDAEEDMDLEDASDGEDDDEAECDNVSISISPANSDQLLGPVSLGASNHCLKYSSDGFGISSRDSYSSKYMFRAPWHAKYCKKIYCCSDVLTVTSEDVFLDPLRYQKFPAPGGKPMHIRRGPGRPRKDRPLGYTRTPNPRRGMGRGSRGKG